MKTWKLILLLISVSVASFSQNKPTPFATGILVKGTSEFTKQVAFGDTITLKDGSKLPAPKPTTNPTATISLNLSSTQEYMASGSALAITVTWSITRPTDCRPITSITVAGTSITPNAIAEGQSQSGTLASTQARNTNTTYTVAVSSADKTGNASSTITWSWKRYWGTVTSTTVTDADILALTGAGVGIGSEFATSLAKTYNGITGGGKYLVFAFPSSWGTPIFKVYGLTNTAFTKIRDNTFVNASGGSTNYQVWVSNTPYNSVVTDFKIE